MTPATPAGSGPIAGVVRSAVPDGRRAHATG
jgi:hypothetical protein